MTGGSSEFGSEVRLATKQPIEKVARIVSPEYTVTEAKAPRFARGSLHSSRMLAYKNRLRTAIRSQKEGSPNTVY